MNLFPARFVAALSLLVAFLAFPLSSLNSIEGWQEYPGNPIISERAGNWDAFHVVVSSVVKTDDKYQMYYDGNGGSGWKTGYAYSTDGITSWTRSNQPIIPIGTPDGWEKETADPLVLRKSPTEYIMWYSSIDTTHWTYGPDRFRLRMATSTDGVNWSVRPGWVLTGTPGKWDSGGIARGLSVIYRDGTYYLWYGGTNENNLETSPYWAIGYATSTNGYEWIKQNLGNPIIVPTESWEFNNFSYPTVIYEGGIYRMWYATGARDMPTQIVYAYSTDGINWDKPANRNPVLSVSNGTFYSNGIFFSSIIRDGDTFKTWFSGYGRTQYGDLRWRIGYATAAASLYEDIPTPTPTSTTTPTPTPTSSPTPTPTLTPTPTPTPVSTNKVVVVPGMGASWNADAILNCKADGYSGNWSLNPLAYGVYNPLLTQINNLGYSPLPYYYDWRKFIPSHVGKLADFIGINTLPEEKVYLVGHSMGGLVGRAYLEQTREASKLDRLLTVGSPHQGVPLAYPGWSAGDSWGNDILWRFAQWAISNFCGGTPTTRRQMLQAHLPSIQNLLPITDYLRDVRTASLKPVSEMHAQNNWLPFSHFSPPFWDVTVGTLSGTDHQTLEIIRVKNRNRIDALLGNWEDGRPVGKEKTTEGDGTVLLSSSQISGAMNIVISQSHRGLISSTDGINEILNFLDINVISNSTSNLNLPLAEPQSALVIIGYPANFWIVDPYGQSIKDTDGLVAITNPRSGQYKLRLFPKSLKTRFVVAQFLEDERTVWKEYRYNFPLPWFKAIQFNPQNPVEDALK